MVIGISFGILEISMFNMIMNMINIITPKVTKILLDRCFTNVSLDSPIFYPQIILVILDLKILLRREEKFNKVQISSR